MPTFYTPRTPNDFARLIPSASFWRKHISLTPQSKNLPSIDQLNLAPPKPTAPPQLVDWLDSPQQRSSHFIAEKTCEMICYLWFASPSANNTLQFTASVPFVSFMQKLLETTQVSQSVIVLSLHYIYRLKARNASTTAQPGSEFRIAVAALIMANKFLDDNTYTNKTWSDVSGIALSEINRMEREFLAGVGHQLYVNRPTYESWLSLLKGLVFAKERDTRRWRSSRSRPTRLVKPVASYHHRARSTSPSHPRPIPPHHHHHHHLHHHHQPQPSYHYTGLSKRSADTAFSDGVRQPPQKKRPTVHIPSTPPKVLPAIPSPLESLSKLSLGSPRQSQTLVSAYTQSDAARMSQPDTLYYYSLSCSPLDETEDEERKRKARLRYHQPQPRPAVTIPPPIIAPVQIHSAHSSPYALRYSPLPPIPQPVQYRYEPVSNGQLAPFANNGPPGIHFYQPGQRWQY